MTESSENEGVNPVESTWGQAALRNAGGGSVGGASSPDPTVGAEQADATQAVPGWTPPAGVAPGGAAGRPSSGPGTRRSGSKPIRGPRFSGGPLIAGLGLLSLLVVIAIMAILSVKILDGTRGTAAMDQIAPRITVEQPGSGDGSGEGSGSGSSDAAGTGTVDAAATGACLVDRTTIETAVAAYEAMNGRWPTSIEDLVSESLLDGGQDRFELRDGPDGVEVVGIGACDGIG